ncbi:hypothetical protein K7640_11015 [Micromonospora sp. PLK6-60]|uniref:hypothetical protein n=1 Tax=Micromonospora sp. PLK6-60 TaxID=2873383 RepID=UPI001CA79D42|nr:hypothetical protein [Micromonospora sp. PLK6-60]MBY8872369.1 hypothetical protein [Micromonospora sp. PLK6-60]
MRVSTLLRPLGAAALAVALLTAVPVTAGAAPGGKPGKPGKPTPSPTAVPPPSPTQSPAPTPTASPSPAPVVLGGTITPSTIVAGQLATQTITLTGPAPAGGLWVYLSADVVYGAFVGSSVHVPEGRTSITFPIRLAAGINTTLHRTLHAQATGQGLVPAGTVTVVPEDPAVQGVKDLRFDRRVVFNGSDVTGTVELTAPARAGGINVDLWSNTAYTGVRVFVPALVVVPEGATTVSFTVPVRGDNVPGEGRPGAYLGSTGDSSPVAAVPTTFAVGGAYVPVGGTTTGVVGIGDTPNPDGTRVSLSVDLPGVSVPATVDVPPGSPGAVFPITGPSTLPPSSTGTVTATWQGRTATGSLFVGY